jgi:hypothetical protein
MRVVVVVLILAAIAQIGVRALRHRDEVPLWDFAAVYSAARTWVSGGDPYDQDTVRQTWEKTGTIPGANVEHWSSVYPPTSLTMIAAAALLPARAAMIGWTVLTLVLVALQFAALLDLAGLKLSWRDPRGLLLIAASLAAAPLQFGLLSGQPSTPAIALCIIAIWCICRNREMTGGVLLGLACAWKPHVGAPFLIYYLALRRWRATDAALLVIALLAAVSLTAMQLSHVNWMNGWYHNVQQTLAQGGVNDRAPSGPFRDEIIDLQTLLTSILDRDAALRVSAACVIALLIAWYVRSYPRSLRRPAEASGSRELLPLAALAALSLMAVYHRVYDAAILTLALAWALAALHGPRRRIAIAALILLSVFLIPFDILSSITRRVRPIADVSDDWWWETFIVPHYAWGLLALTVALLWGMSRTSLRLAPRTSRTGPAGAGGHDALPVMQ